MPGRGRLGRVRKGEISTLGRGRRRMGGQRTYVNYGCSVRAHIRDVASKHGAVGAEGESLREIPLDACAAEEVGDMRTDGFRWQMAQARWFEHQVHSDHGPSLCRGQTDRAFTSTPQKVNILFGRGGGAASGIRFHECRV